jgi:hypothetical protein
MDLHLRGFEKITYPNLVQHRISPSTSSIQKSTQKAISVPTKTAHPVMDVRYPAYAGHFEDARFGTDYRPQCSKNIQPQHQFMTKRWMVHHADEIMRISRQRQSEWTGAGFGVENTVPPPAQTVSCTPFSCNIEHSVDDTGIGIERLDSKCPQLFGTFEVSPTINEMQIRETKRIGLTSVYEGGRNTPRNANPHKLY